MIAATPEPPYVAVIFTSVRTGDDEGYAATAAEMELLAHRQPGFLGLESAREGLGITVSYWRTEQDARAWKQVADHLVAQRLGRDRWYAGYRVRVATVTRDYGPKWRVGACGAPGSPAAHPAHQPRARHSASDGRSAPRVVSLPCPG